MAAGGAVEVRLAQSGRDDAAVARLMEEYLTWALQRLETEYGITDLPVDPVPAASSLNAYYPPRGRLAVAEVAGQPAGIGAVRSLGDGVAEVKRMYVAPTYRGRGVGAAVLDFLLTQIEEDLDADTVRLDTCLFMTSAQRLYRSRGFVQRSAYEGSEIPVRLQQYWYFFERATG